MKTLVLVLLAAIVISLGSGLFYLTRDGTDSPRLLKALKIRVALTVLLVVALVVTYKLGYIQ